MLTHLLENLASQDLYHVRGAEDSEVYEYTAYTTTVGISKIIQCRLRARSEMT